MRLGDGCTETIVDVSAVARAAAAVPGDVHVRRMADIFSALADPTRLKVLSALSAGPMCVCDIAETTGSSQSAVSHQLRILRDRRLVAFTRDGRRAVYRLEDSHVASLLEQGSEHAGEQS